MIGCRASGDAALKPLRMDPNAKPMARDRIVSLVPLIPSTARCARPRIGHLLEGAAACATPVGADLLDAVPEEGVETERCGCRQFSLAS